MVKNLIKYGGLALVVVGIILVMKNLFDTGSNLDKSEKKNKSNNVVTTSDYYNASVSLLDQDSKGFISGASLVVKDSQGNVISEWTTEGGVHLVPNLKKGTYSLIQQTVADGYRLNSDGVQFEITNKNQEVVMYNIKMTEEEIKQKEAEERAKNTTSNEVNVDNTLSEKGVTAIVMSIMCLVAGLTMFLYKKAN